MTKERSMVGNKRSKTEMEKWFDPAFQEFIDKELIPKDKRN
jgi:hypothetical protein